MGGVAFEKSSSAATLLPVQLLVDRAAFTFNPLGSEVILGPLRCFDMS